ncbi:hypothetical protein PLESTB_001395900 [Pleodorina starrii]|uniref:RNA helicase n=1 Tax=Pleodorina starrii TaxID=330485 RepID=A0A9W6F7P2_9CHLO|nr:hypothetical protein PLESTM_000536400 [Pleodorina starrii]GLC58741.1 hypothetical protein PLESTB_001395900 [Pleodorina starrii]GLC75174.1 hypothetical protein PLESTF_001603200 [Pleodorina starrii]
MMSSQGCIARGQAFRPTAICPVAVHDVAPGARLWPDRRCLPRPAGGSRLSPWPHAPTAARNRRIATSPATRDGGGGGGGGDLGSEGGEAAGGAPLWGSGGAYGGYGLYGEYDYNFDLDSQQPPGPASRGASLAALAANLAAIDDTNALQTALAAAISSEDFELAAAVRDRLRQVAGGGVAGGRIDWASTGMSEWLADRAQRLGYSFPTEIQRRSAPVLLSGSDAVVASETGSGKTLSFLMPLLDRLTYPPEMFPDEMKGPQAVVLVPTLELGVQVALLAFRLLGGNVSTGRPGDAANMFTYFGPKGIKVRGVLNKEEVVMSKSSLTYTAGVHLLVATPGALMEAVREPQSAGGGQLLGHIKVLAVDEVDECFNAFPGDMDELMARAVERGGSGDSGGAKPQVVFVGATQRQDVLTSAVARGWLREPVSIQVGREGTVPPALSHRYIVVPAPRRLAALARSLRSDLAAADQDSAPARVMLFVNTPEQAAAVAEPLRSSLWSDHRMAVLVPPGTILGRDAASDLPPGASSSTSSAPNRSGSPSSAPGPSAPTPAPWLPSSPPPPARGGSGSGRAIGGRGDDGEAPASGSGYGSESGSGSGDGFGVSGEVLEDMFAYNPIRALHSFRDHKSSLLLATGAAARGLDLPGVSHVYSLGPPPDATQYLHRAGRAGRIGSTSGGIVTTLVTPEELPALLAMGDQLGIRLVREEEASGELLGALARMPEPQEQDEDESESEDGGEGDGSGGRAGQGKAAGGAGAGGSGSEGLVGDVEQLRKGLEDLFNLM